MAERKRTGGVENRAVVALLRKRVFRSRQRHHSLSISLEQPSDRTVAPIHEASFRSQLCLGNSSDRSVGYGNDMVEELIVLGEEHAMTD